MGEAAALRYALGIRYEHLPELGIASEKRKNLATQAGVDALFAEYERDSLPTQGPGLAKLRAWLDAGARVALTCFERAPATATGTAWPRRLRCP